jgi:riboflavin kinase/FMN adenylyltransferase
VKIHDEVFKGVANIGHRPTVDGTRSQLEVHLFDFQEDLYGQTISVVPTAKLREEQKFDSFDNLKQQIVDDAKQARLALQSTAE